MSAFRYEALDAQGKVHKGVLDADSARAARMELRAQDMIPVSVELVSTQGSTNQETVTRQVFRPRLGQEDLAVLTRQLASLLEAGLPLEQVLSVLIEQSERAFLRDALAAVRSEVMGGMGLADALRRGGDGHFSETYCALVASGEQTGQMASVLARLADFIERRNALMSKVRLAFTYPAIVSVVALVIVIFLLTYVVPQIVSVFSSTKQHLPFLTTAMLALSDFIRHQGWGVLLALAALSFAVRGVLRNPQIRRRWHARLLSAPLYGRFERSLNTARFASTLAITTGSGVPILRALHTSRDTVANLAMREQIDFAAARVREGSSLAVALGGRHSHFPPMLVHMIRAGEVTGELPSMLNRAALAQEQDLERRALKMASLLEPLLILAMGVIVLLIVLAVLMPIIEINQLIR